MLEFSAGFGVGRFVKDWRGEINTVSDANRAAMAPEQGARSFLPIQQTPHRQSDSFGLVASGEAVGDGLDQSDDVGAIDGDDGWHGAIRSLSV